MRILRLVLLLAQGVWAAGQAPLSFVLDDIAGGAVTKAVPLPNGNVLLIGTRQMTVFSNDGIGPPDHTVPILPSFSDEVAFPGFGNGNTIPADGAVDKIGNIWLVGTTDSDDFPLVKPIVSQKQSYRSTGFVMKLDPTASQILFSSFLGGGSPYAECCASSAVVAMALDSAGNAYILGNTTESNFPTTLPGFGSGVPGPRIAGPNGPIGQVDAFLVKIAADSSALVFSELIGANACVTSCYVYGDTPYTTASALAVDSSGNVTIAGGTDTKNFPVTASAFQPVACPLLCFGNGFVSRISSDGKTMLWSTYLGSPMVFQDDGPEPEIVNWMTLDGEGNVYVSGTSTGDFPVTTGALQTTRPMPLNMPQPYVAKLSATGSTLLWATYLGGTASSAIHGLALDSSGNLFVTGTTTSLDFPSLPGIPALGNDFALELNAGATALQRIYRLPTGTTSQPPSFDDQGRLLLLASNGSLLRLDANNGLTTPAIFAVTNTVTLTPDTGATFGELMTIFGAGLGPSNQLTGQPDANGVYPTSLGGIRVSFGDWPAPLLAVAANQITLQVPFMPETDLGPHYGPMQIITGGAAPAALPLPYAGSPTIFESTPGWAAALNADSTVNSAANPAKPRSLVTIYVNGLFCSNLPVSGMITKTAQETYTSYYPSSGGFPLPVYYSGTAPGIIDGICQFNVQLPDATDPELTLVSPSAVSFQPTYPNTVKIHAQ